VLQPGQPLDPAGQRPRQLVPSGGAVLAVLGPIRLGGLEEQLGDLGLEGAWVRLAAAAALASILVPSNATRPRRTMPAAAHSLSEATSSPARACSWRVRNRAMVT
jgi:hypothetical protein